MDKLAFSETFTLDDIKRAITAADVVMHPGGDKSWTQSTFMLTLEGAKHQISAVNLVGMLADRNVRSADITEIFNQHGFKVKRTDISTRLSQYNARKLTEPKDRTDAHHEEFASEGDVSKKDEDAISSEAFLHNRNASTRIQANLVNRYQLKMEEAERLPSYAFLERVVQSLLLSTTAEMMNMGIEEMFRQKKGCVTLPAAQGHYDMSTDAMTWNFRLTGFTPHKEGEKRDAATRNAGIAKAYEELLVELIKFRRGEKRSDQFLVTLDARLTSKSPFNIVQTNLHKLWPSEPEVSPSDQSPGPAAAAPV